MAFQESKPRSIVSALTLPLEGEIEGDIVSTPSYPVSPNSVSQAITSHARLSPASPTSHETTFQDRLYVETDGSKSYPEVDPRAPPPLLFRAEHPSEADLHPKDPNDTLKEYVPAPEAGLEVINLDECSRFWRRRKKIWIAVAIAVVLIAAIAGGVVGGLLGSKHHSHSPAAGASTGASAPVGNISTSVATTSTLPRSSSGSSTTLVTISSILKSSSSRRHTKTSQVPIAVVITNSAQTLTVTSTQETSVDIFAPST
jgi:hypothetical protein